MSDVSFLFDGWRPIARVLVVGTLAYVCLIALLRLSGNRTLARMNAFDFLVTVALGASFGRILTARSIPLVEAVTAFALLVALQWIVSWLKVRSTRVAQLVTAKPVLLAMHGEAQRDVMRQQRVTDEELLAALRKHGLSKLEDADAVVLESNGRISVLRNVDHEKVEGLSSVRK